MKFIRLMIIAVFLLGILPVSVSAQETSPAEVSGYIVLVRDLGSADDVYAQANLVYDRLRFLLDDAVAEGRLLSYSPKLQLGVVKVVAAPMMPLSGQINGLPVVPDLATAVSQVFASRNQSAPGVQPLAYNPIFDLTLGDECFSVRGLNSGDMLVGSLRDSSNVIQSATRAQADSNGEIGACFDIDPPISVVLPGTRVTFKVYSSSWVLRGTYTAVTPNLKVTAIDKANSILRGVGPANSSLNVQWSYLLLDGDQSSFGQEAITVVGPTGSWEVDFGTTPMRPDAYYQARLIVAARFLFHRRGFVPYLSCHITRTQCDLRGFPSTPAYISFTRAGVTTTYKGLFDNLGYFRADYAKPDGTPIRLIPGDKISGTAVAPWVLPRITTSLNFATDVVSGYSPPGKWSRVWACLLGNGFCDVTYNQWKQSSPTGTYSANFAAQHNFQPYEAFVFGDWFIDPVTGNMAGTYKSIGP